jgi:SAM-dependent methyltransferase
MSSYYDYDTYNIDVDDTWVDDEIDKDESKPTLPITYNYQGGSLELFNISSIVEDNLDCLDISFKDFKDKNDYTEQLYYFLIYNIEHFNKYYRLTIDESNTSMFSILLSNITITNNDIYKYYIDLYVDNIKLPSQNELKLVYLNIISHNNIECFNYFNKFHPVSSIICESDIDISHYYTSLNYNIVNHSMCSSKYISEYIFENCKLNVFNHLYVHVFLNINIKTDYYIIIDKIQQELEDEKGKLEKKKYSISEYILVLIQNSGYSKKYDKLISIIIHKLNDITIYNYYINNALNNTNYYAIKDLFKQRELIVSKFDYTAILNKLFELCTDKIYNKEFSVKKNVIYINKLWCYLFPYIEKYYDDDLEAYFSDKDLNQLVTIANAKQILKKIDKYIECWNIQDKSNFTPILDCIRYGTYDTLKFMITKYDIDLLVESYDGLNILSCALFNSDIRVLKYVKDIINSNNVLKYYITQHTQSDYICIIYNSKFTRKKIEIIRSIFGYLDLDYICNIYFHKIDVLIYLVTTYKHKINLNKVLHITRTPHYDCISFDKIKIILDNINYDISPYYHVVEFISSLGCINLVLNSYNHIFTHFNLKKTILYDSYSIIFDAYKKMMDNRCQQCTDCKHYRFKDYIVYLRTHILIQSASYNYYINKYVIDDCKFIKDLYLNGIYPKDNNYYITLNDSYFISLIRLCNINRRMKSNVTKWNIVICVLKEYVRKRYKKMRKKHMEKQYIINNQLTYRPDTFNQILFKSSNPKHIEPNDCFKPLHETHLYITQKADGLSKKGLYTIFPTIDYTNYNIDIELVEYEFIKDENICYFYNYRNNPYNFIMFLRRKHPYIDHIDYPSLNLSNYKTVLNDYSKNEYEQLSKFKELYKSRKKWWPKYIFKIELMSHSNYLKLLNHISNINLECIKNDGWILINNDYNDLIKIKPYKQMTIDLIYKNNNLYDNDNQTYKWNNTMRGLKENKIYRCYYDNETQCWIPTDLRKDKFKPNSKILCHYIQKCHIYPWSIIDTLGMSPYYQKNICNPLSIYKTHGIHKDNSFIEYIIGTTILDLGCGFSKKYIGIDIDPKANMYNHYIGDLSRFSDTIEQSDNIYRYFKNIHDFKEKYRTTRFDTVLSINSIQYFINNDFLSSINNYTKKGTKFIVKFLNRDLFLSLLYNNKYISHNSSFVRIHKYTKLSQTLFEPSLYIKIYYEWCHHNPIIEKVYSKNELELIFKKYGWKIEKYSNSTVNIGYLSDWELYFKCFSVLVFVKD